MFFHIFLDNLKWSQGCNLYQYDMMAMCLVYVYIHKAKQLYIKLFNTSVSVEVNWSIRDKMVMHVLILICVLFNILFSLHCYRFFHLEALLAPEPMVKPVITIRE